MATLLLYNPQKAKTAHHLKVIRKHLDFYSSKYENYVFVRDLISELIEN